MNLNHLSIFQAVAATGGVSAAAYRLGLSQSAVSRQIGEFERNLGLQLFDRLPRGVRLTEAGRRLQAYADQLVSTEAQAEEAIRDIKTGVKGRIRIGASRSTGAYLLPGILARFVRAHPGVEVSMDVESSANIERKLFRDEIDIGFAEGIPEDSRLEYHRFARDELVLIAAPDHLIVGEAPVSPMAVSRHALLMHEPGSGTRAVTERAFASKGLTLRPLMTLASTEAIKQTVATGIGIALLSSAAVRNELTNGTLVRVPMKGLRIERPLYRLLRVGAWRSPAMEGFVQLLSAGR